MRRPPESSRAMTAIRKGSSWLAAIGRCTVVKVKTSPRPESSFQPDSKPSWHSGQIGGRRDGACRPAVGAAAARPGGVRLAASHQGRVILHPRAAGACCRERISRSSALHCFRCHSGSRVMPAPTSSRAHSLRAEQYRARRNAGTARDEADLVRLRPGWWSRRAGIERPRRRG